MFGNGLNNACLRSRKEAVLRRTRASGEAPSRHWRGSRRFKITAAFVAVLGLFGTGIVTGANAAPITNPAPVGNGFTITPGDLLFILKQIKIAERHSQAIAANGADAVAVEPDPSGDPSTAAR